LSQNKQICYKELLLKAKETAISVAQIKDLPEESYHGDEADIQVNFQENKIRVELLRRNGIHLKKIERALLKIRNQTFGICETCEEDIEENRLMSSPIVDLCISCKEGEELTAHSFGKNLKEIS